MRIALVCASVALCVLCVLPIGCLPEPQLEVRLDGAWLFRPDPERLGMTQRWYAPELSHHAWTEVALPSTWETAPGLREYDGWGWYARMIVLDDSVPPLSLYFAGVDDDAVVWINGERVAEHTGYSEPFTVDASGRLRPGENLLVVLVNDHGGPGGIPGAVTLVASSHLEQVMRGPYAGRRARPSAPWVRDAVIYSVYLRSFSQEGTFGALQRRLPELKAMGVTVLWLLPIHPVGKLKRKGTLGSPYAVRDYYDVNPEFGTLEDFRSLVEAVHAQGMHIILDLVANHTAWDNALLRDHPEWYTHDSTGAVIPPDPLYSDVADLDYSQPGLRRYMQTMMCWWVDSMQVDGFRCDVAELVPREFWEETRERLDAIKPVMMIAEGTLPEYHLEAFDLTYAWTTYEMLQGLLRGERPAAAVHKIMHTEALTFPVGSLHMRFTTNHDKNYWDAPAVELFGQGGLRLGAALMAALPGVPMIYTGEEVANNRRLSLFEKVDVDWTRPRSMGDLYRELAQMRTQHPALRDGDYQPLPCDDRAVLAFLRATTGDSVLCVFNFSGERRSATIHLPALARAGLRMMGSEGRLAVGMDGLLDLTLSPRGFVLAARER